MHLARQNYFACAALALLFATAPARSADTPSPDPFQTLINQLGDQDPKIREHAESTLVDIGPPAWPALIAALNHDDLEIKIRAGQALEEMRVKLARTTFTWDKPLSMLARTSAGTGMLTIHNGNQTLFILPADNLLIAHDLSNPKNLKDLPPKTWSADNPAGTPAAGFLAQAGNLLLATNAQYELHAFDISNGNEKWLFKDSSPHTNVAGAARGPATVVPGLSPIFVPDPHPRNGPNANPASVPVVYVASPTHLFGIELLTGTAALSVEGFTGVIGGPVANDSQVFVATPANGIRVFDRKTGSEQLTILATASIYSRPTVTNDALFVQTRDGVVGYDLKKDQVAWTHPGSAPTAAPLPGQNPGAVTLAARPLAGRVSIGLIPPVLHDGRLYVASLDTLSSIDPDLAQNKEPKTFWSWQPSPLPTNGQPAATEPAVPGVGISRTIQILTLPVFTNKQALIATAHGLFAIDLAAGRPAWEFHPSNATIIPTQLAPAAVTDGIAHVAFMLQSYRDVKLDPQPLDTGDLQVVRTIEQSRHLFAIPLEK